MLQKRKYIIFCSILFLACITVLLVFLYRDNNKLVFVAADSTKGFHYGYYYYTPKNSKNSLRPYILVEPNNTGYVSDDNKVHKQSAKDMIEYRLKKLADELECIVLVPVFDRPQSNLLMYTHALDRDTMLNTTGPLARIDLQLINMIDDLKSVLKGMGIDTQPKILMNGFSASGTFVNRFAALHPDLVQAVASGGINSMPILPLYETDGIHLIYPIGVSDIETIVSQKFDLDTYVKIHQYVYMGANDDNDTLPFDDAFSPEEKGIILDVLGSEMKGRWEKSKQIYAKLGCSAEFVLYDDVGHEVTKDITLDIIDFFRASMNYSIDTTSSSK